MQLHQLRIKSTAKNRKRVGRGGKRGTYSGKGIKGQKSRSGPRFEPIIRPLIKRYHKLKGVSYTSTSKPIILAVVNLGFIDKKFKSGEVVSPETLLAKGLVDRKNKKVPAIKILGQGEVKQTLKFEHCFFSESARSKILAVGGEISGEKVKKGKKVKKQLTPEEIQSGREMIRKQMAERRAAKKKSAERRKKEAQKGKKK